MSSLLFNCSQPAVCTLCKKKLISPVKLPCGHIVCDHCLRNFLAETRRCALKDCAKEFEPDQLLQQETQQIPEETRNQLLKFQKRCNHFVSEVVSRFTFAKALSRMLILMLIDYSYFSLRVIHLFNNFI